MIRTKYFERIRALAAEQTDLSTFAFGKLGKGGGLAASLIRSRTVHALLRIFWPVGRIGGFGWVVRHADVAEVRRRSDEFLAPYGEEMVQLTGGSNFLLGMQDGPAYRRQLAFMRQVLRPQDISDLISPNAARLARQLLACSGGEIDAVDDLLFRVAAETCADYFGLEIEDATAFAQWLMSLSALLFADYFGSAETHQLAMSGAVRLRRLIDEAIAKARSIGQHRTNRNVGPEEGEARAAWFRSTVIGRLVKLQLENPAAGPSDDEIRAIVMGTAVGYVPTGGGAGGNILNVLLERPEWLERARVAASTDDDAALSRILGEALRFAPPIDPGLPRYVARRAKVRGVTFPEGSAILVASKAAMFDGRAINDPKRFDPDRDLSRDLQFGGDFLHYCLGEPIARALLLETFKPLLRQTGLKRAGGKAGRLTTTGPFPQHLHVRFEAASGWREQSMVTICLEVTEPVPAAEIEKEIDRLGNPARKDLRAALDATDRIHFAHISVIAGETDTQGRKRTPTFVVVEFTADGEANGAIDALVDFAGQHFLRVFTLAVGVSTSDDLKAVLKRGVRRLVAGRLIPRRSTASGLNFPGTPELSVPEIARDRKTAELARACLDRHLASRKGRGALASPALQSVREQIRATARRHELVRPAGVAPAVSRRGDRDASATLASFLSDPSVIGAFAATFGATLVLHLLLMPETYAVFRAITDLSMVTGLVTKAGLSLLTGAAAAVGLLALLFVLKAAKAGGAASPGGARLIPFLGLSLLFGILHFIVFQNATGVAPWDESALDERFWLFARAFWEFLVALTIAVVIYVLAISAAVGLFLLLLRRSETTGASQDLDPAFDHVKQLLRRENPEGYVQNHLIAVTPLKTNPRWLRRFTLGLAFWGIEMLVKHRFRPGFVLDIGTIHYARWFRLPKTDKLVFLANYDGSWESYLEDFITKAHLGQTAVWSNGVGFPETRFLLFGGASDGARFKRWVRRQQVESRFWYSRFPDATTEQMRNDALICDGLAKAHTESEAQAWLDLFGTRPRPRHALEYDEIQSVVFSGFGKLQASMLIPVRVPEKNQRWQEWLLDLIGAEEYRGSPTRTVRVTFGDTPPQDFALALAVSAEGLRRFGLADLVYHQDGQAGGVTLDSFPNAFVDGMASEERARILGDAGNSASSNWAWARPGAEPHIVLLLYASDDAALESSAASLTRQLSEELGFEVLPAIRMQTRTGDREPFGFRDGLSQPIIRDSRPLRDPGDAIHVVEPGEFVLGYPDNRGDIPPSPVVAATYDHGILPNLVAHLPDRFPAFTADDESAPRDFGRNGTFLVIRQLEQDAAAFENHLEEKARDLKAAFPGLAIDSDWLAARLMGRWRDGSPLVRYPLAPGGEDRPANDFMFGAEDPQGLRCPYGAHIRRAFPRDSLNPGSSDQLKVSNRHRLLRRGRPYVQPGEAPGGKASGIVFMCLNADIERQFEFVQQTWLSSPFFHGLAGEPDPVATSNAGNASQASFTIPMSFGPMGLRGMQSFVTVRNGGYFFLPGWSAIRFLATLGR